MKRTILAFIFSILAVTIYAKSVTFMGVPVGGNATAFINKMKSKGFRLDMSNDNYVWMMGKFMGEDAALNIIFPKDKSNVYSVDVYLEKPSSLIETTKKIKRVISFLRPTYGDFNYYEGYWGCPLDNGGIAITTYKPFSKEMIKITFTTNDAVNAYMNDLY